MSATRRAPRNLALVLVPAIIAACGGATVQPPRTDPPSASGAPGATATADAPAPTPGPAGSAVVIADLCALVGGDAVGAALGETVEAGTTATAVGSTTCTFTSTESGATVQLSLTEMSSLSSWEFQMGTLGVTAEDAVPRIGESAYAKAGLPFGGSGAFFDAYQAGTAVGVTISSEGDQEALVEAATAIGRALVTAIS